MSRESAMAKATGATAPTTPANPAANQGFVTARQAARIPVPKEPVQEGAPAPIVVPAEESKIETSEPVSEVAEGLTSDKFAHLAKKEAKLQKEREALKAEQKATAEAKVRYETVEKQFREFEELKGKDPIAAMKLAGFSDTDIFNYYANAEKEKAAKDTPEARAAAAAQAEIKKFQDEQSKKEVEAKKASDDAVIKRFKDNISKTITSDKDKYEYCNFNGIFAEDLIYLTVENVLQDTGEVISAQEAADMVESFYEEQDKAMNSLKKRGIKPKEEVLPVQEVAPTPAKSKTLSNKVAPTVASTVITKRETPAEKKARLVEQIKQYGLRK